MNFGLANSLASSRMPLGGGFTGPLDAYTSGLAGAWSVRRRLLASYTGPLFQVRRSSGSPASSDIGYDGAGDMDEAALLAFCAGVDGFVAVIYDQSGNGRNLIQGTASAQARIVSAGALETLGGLPVAKVTASNTQFYPTNTFTAYTGSVLSFFARAAISNVSPVSYSEILAATKDALFSYNAASRCVGLIRNAAGATVQGYRNSAGLGSAAVTAAVAFAASGIFDGTNYTVNAGGSDSSAASSGSFDINRWVLWGYGASNPYASAGDCGSEFLIYTADKTADAAAIRALLA